MCGEVKLTVLSSHPSTVTVALGKLLTYITLEFPHLEVEMLILRSFHNTYPNS